MKCVGNHWDDWELEEEDPEADYFRECSYCGIQIDLCIACRDRIFLCDRCYRAQIAVGKEEARQVGRARERRRLRDRRRRLLLRRSA